MEFWLTLLLALPGAISSVLTAYDWFQDRQKKREKAILVLFSMSVAHMPCPELL